RRPADLVLQPLKHSEPPEDRVGGLEAAVWVWSLVGSVVSQRNRCAEVCPLCLRHRRRVAQTTDNRTRVRLKSWRRSQASAKVPFVLLQADVARIHVIRATFLFAPEVSAGDSPDCVSASPLVVPAPLSGTYLSVGGQSRRR